MRKRIICFLGVIYVLLFVCTTTAANEETEEYHVVIMYDVSASMKDVDNKKQAADMIVRFVNQIPHNRYPLKVSVVPFATKPVSLAEKYAGGWWYLKDENEDIRLAELGEAVSTQEYDGKHTDIGQALQYCRDMLIDMRSDVKNCRQFVVFITDGLIDVGKESEFVKNIDSYQKVLDAADTFPEDCCFLGIVPAEEAIADKITYKKDAEGNRKCVINYVGHPVPGEYQEEAVNVVNAMDRFIERLSARQPGKQLYKSKLENVNWNDKNVLKKLEKIYETFFEDIFNTGTIEVDGADLGDGYTFSIPEDMLVEAVANVEPEENAVEKKREIIQKIITDGGITVLREGKECQYKILNSRSSVTIKLINPNPGNYTIRCTVASNISCDLKFLAYGKVKMDADADVNTGVLGQSVRLQGKILKSDGESVSRETMDRIKVWIRNVNTGEKKELPNSENSEFSYDYVLDAVGDNYLTLGMTYDDSQEKDKMEGVSCFSAESEPFCIHVSDVDYELGDIPEKIYNWEKVTIPIIPYSILDDQKYSVDASVCYEKLNHSWVLSVNGQEQEKLILSEDGKSFVTEQIFKEKGRYNLEFQNEMTGQIIQREVDVENAPVLITLPETAGIGEKITVQIAVSGEVEDPLPYEMLILDEQENILERKKSELKSEQGSAEFIAEQKGKCEVRVNISGYDTSSRVIEITNNAPVKTEIFPESLEISCFLWGKKCVDTVDVSKWFTEKDGHRYEIVFKDNDYYEMTPKTISSDDNMTISIKRKSKWPVHLPKKSVIKVSAVDQYGMESSVYELMIHENISVWLLRGIAGIIAIIIFTIIARILRVARCETYYIYKENIYVKKTRLPKKEGVPQPVKVGNDHIEVIYRKDGSEYIYRGEQKSIINNNIRL